MSVEINRARVAADGTVSCEFVFPNIGSFVRVANDALRVEPAGFAPDYYGDAQARLRIAAEREAKREAAQTATGLRLPRASMPPYDTTLGGQPVGGFMSFSEDEQKAGGTD